VLRLNFEITRPVKALMSTATLADIFIQIGASIYAAQSSSTNRGDTEVKRCLYLDIGFRASARSHLPQRKAAFHGSAPVVERSQVPAICQYCELPTCIKTGKLTWIQVSNTLSIRISLATAPSVGKNGID
jgi:hypothetical protein